MVTLLATAGDCTSFVTSGGVRVARSRLRRLVNKSQFAPHQYAVGADTFPRLNLDHVSRTLNLVELGQERGAAEEPPQSEQGLDDVEDRVLSFIRNKHAEALSAFEDQRQTYNQRLAKLGFHSVVGEIEDAAKSASAEIEAETLKAKDLVGDLRAGVEAAAAEWVAFRETHGLTRPARYPEGVGDWVLRWGLILVIVLLETAMNGYFFGQGNDMGLVGGWFEAGLIATVNVTLGFVAGRLPARWSSHRVLAVKAPARAVVFVWFVIAVTLNLVVGHYRVALEALAPHPETVALTSFLADPIGLSSTHSWLLLVIGVFFSSLAAIDGWVMDDPYPSYGGVDRRLRKARQRYADERADLLDEVRRIYDGGLQEVASRASQIGKRRDEGESIRAGMESLKLSFEAHLQYLEDSANGLLDIYRDANRKARPPKTSPASFRRRWKRDFPPPEAAPAPAFTEAALAALIKKGEQRRRHGEKRLEQARAGVVAAFPPLSESL